MSNEDKDKRLRRRFIIGFAYFWILWWLVYPVPPPAQAQFFGGSSNTINVTNAGATGTLANGLAKLTGAPSTAVRAAAGDAGGAIGVVTAGAGTTGSATIQIKGLVNCVFENATTAGDFVGIGTGTAGNCRDIGTTYPVSGEVIGVVLSTNGAAGTYQIDLFSADIRNGAGGSIAAGTTNGVAIYTGATAIGSTALGPANTVLTGTGVAPAFSATPSISSATLTANTNQLVLGTTNTMTITMAALASSFTLTLPAANSNPIQPLICGANNAVSAISAAGVLTCSAFASTALSNLAAVAINTALLPNAAGTINLGSAALPFQFAFIGGAATNNNQITSAVTTAARTFTLPDANSNPIQPLTCGANTAVTAINSAGALTCTSFGTGAVSSATAGDVAVYTAATTVGKVASDNLFFDTTNQVLGINRGTTPTTTAALDIFAKTGVTDETATVIIGQPDATANSTTVLELRTGAAPGTARLRIEANAGAAGNNRIISLTGSQSPFSVLANGTSQQLKLGASGIIAVGNIGGSFTNILADPNTNNNVTINSSSQAADTNKPGLDVFATNNASSPVLRVHRQATTQIGNLQEWTAETVTNPVVLAKIGPLTQPAAGSPGTAEPTVFSITGAGGGNCSDTGACVAGNGGGWTPTLGAGGANTTTTGANAATGGVGGGYTIVAGAGGAASATTTSTNTGGAGGVHTLTAGAGGAATNGTTNNGGAGGSITANLGSGGTGATANGADGTFIIVAGARANADIFNVRNNGGTTQVAVGQTGNLAFRAGKGQHFETQAANNDFAGTATLTAGTVTVTFTTAYTSAAVCVCNDKSSPLACQANGGSNNVVITVTGGASDTVEYICVGNPT